MLKLLSTNAPVRVLPGMACLSHHHLTETVLIQQLASLCGCGINIVSSFGSLGHAKAITVHIYVAVKQTGLKPSASSALVHSLCGLLDGQL